MSHSTARIRHIPFADRDGTCFGDHYITQDPSLRTAEQFDVTVFPRGDRSRIAPDVLRYQPHIRIRTWDGRAWHVASVTTIAASDQSEIPAN